MRTRSKACRSPELRHWPGVWLADSLTSLESQGDRPTPLLLGVHPPASIISVTCPEPEQHREGDLRPAPPQSCPESRALLPGRAVSLLRSRCVSQIRQGF